MADFKTSLTRGEEMFLLTVAVVSAIACATSFYVGYHSNTVIASTQQEDDDAPRVPLAAGPRKYQ